MNFLAAIRFLTIIPLPLRAEPSPEQTGRSLSYFPIVGFIIGLILVSLNWLLGLILPETVVNILLIISLVIISGALHLDGFSDTCDGIAGQKTVEERWAVMRDSRAGAFGVIGVCCLLLLKYIVLSSVPKTLMTATLLLTPVISRWTMVYAIFAYPYARPSGLGSVFKQEARWYRLVMATTFALIPVIIFAGLPGLATMLGAWVIILIMAAYLKRKFAGLTGDTYGAINEVAEASVLLFVSLLAHNKLLWSGL